MDVSACYSSLPCSKQLKLTILHASRLGLSAVPAVIQLIGMLFLPESPRWLVSKSKATEAEAVLTRIRGSNLVAAQEVREIQASIEEEKYALHLFL